jgi:hypothetical protein
MVKYSFNAQKLKKAKKSRDIFLFNAIAAKKKAAIIHHDLILEDSSFQFPFGLISFNIATSMDENKRIAAISIPVL